MNPKSIAVLGELALEDRFNDHLRRGLHDTIYDRRYAQRSLLAAAWLGYVNPFDWLGLVAAFAEVLFDCEQPLLAVFCKVRYRDAVHATGPCVGLHLFPGQLQRAFSTDVASYFYMMLRWLSRYARLSIRLNHTPPLIPRSRAMSIFSLQTPRWALWCCHRASSPCLPVAGTAGDGSSLSLLLR